VQHHADDQHARFALDIARAYPAAAKLSTWKRAIELQRGRHITVTDRYELSAAAPTIEWSLMTPSDVEVTPGALRMKSREILNGRMSATGVVTFEPADLRLVVEVCPIEDQRMRIHWGERMHRVRLIAQDPPRSGTMTITITSA